MEASVVYYWFRILSGENNSFVGFTKTLKVTAVTDFCDDLQSLVGELFYLSAASVRILF
jgi:hypothetical protein